MIAPGEVVSYLRMCSQEHVNLQRGMNFRLPTGSSVVLLRIRPGAPYADRTESNGRVLIYEGHDIPWVRGGPDPKRLDQAERNSTGRLTQNGLFFAAANAYKRGEREAEPVRVYEKIRSGIWVYNGVFRLVDAWKERGNDRAVFKFRFELDESQELGEGMPADALRPDKAHPNVRKAESLAAARRAMRDLRRV